MIPRSLVLAAIVLSSFFARAEDTISFTRTVKPILRERCVHCHNRKTLPERVSLESAASAFTRTAEGLEIIVPGKPGESLLVVAMESPRLHEKAMPLVGMPPTGEEIGLIRRWISEGAKWPGGFRGRIKPTFYPKE